MKKLILTILMLVPAVAYAQEPELSDAQKAASKRQRQSTK